MREWVDEKMHGCEQGGDNIKNQNAKCKNVEIAASLRSSQ
jgi:hypothetical protein